MLQTLLAKVVGTQNERELKRLRPIVGQVNAFEPAISALTDEQLQAKTVEFRARLAPFAERLKQVEAAAGGDEKRKKEALDDLQDALDQLLPEAFAVVREAGRRVLNMRHFDVQILGGAVLHNYRGRGSDAHGKIA